MAVEFHPFELELMNNDYDEGITDRAGVVGSKRYKPPSGKLPSPCFRDFINRNRQISSVRSPGFDCQGPVGRLLDLWFRVESVAKIYMFYYNQDTGDAYPPDTNGGKTINTLYLKQAMRYYRLLGTGANQLNERDYDMIFQGGPGQQGRKSMRQLRNGYLHSLDRADEMEMVRNGLHHERRMVVFLNLRFMRWA